MIYFLVNDDVSIFRMRHALIATLAVSAGLSGATFVAIGAFAALGAKNGTSFLGLVAVALALSACIAEFGAAAGACDVMASVIAEMLDDFAADRAKAGVLDEIARVESVEADFAESVTVIWLRARAAIEQCALGVRTPFLL